MTQWERPGPASHAKDGPAAPPTLGPMGEGSRDLSEGQSLTQPDRWTAWTPF